MELMSKTLISPWKVFVSLWASLYLTLNPHSTMIYINCREHQVIYNAEFIYLKWHAWWICFLDKFKWNKLLLKTLGTRQSVVKEASDTIYQPADMENEHQIVMQVPAQGISKLLIIDEKYNICFKWMH